MPQGRGGYPGRKKNSACYRCRKQKTRCDNDQPCRNCSKAGHQCIRPRAFSSLEAPGGSEQRLQMLQESLRRLDPVELDRIVNLTSSGHPLHASDLAQTSHSFTCRSPGQPGRWDDASSRIEAPDDDATVYAVPAFTSAEAQQGPLLEGQSIPVAVDTGSVENGNTSTLDARASAHDQPTPDSTQIRPNEPLAHNVGLLSLANSHDSKYLGPSSGVSFARQFISAISQSQGSAANLQTPDSGALRSSHRPDPFPSDWSFDVDPRHFLDAYLDTYQPFYPFLDEGVVVRELAKLWPADASRLYPVQPPRLSEFDKLTSPMSSAQLLLVVALGARVLETRLSTEFHSERYLATALSSMDKLRLHDNFQGIQIMLLLALCGLSFVDGPSPWFLTSNIIAACLDLGFQRKWTKSDAFGTETDTQDSETLDDVRRGIFWSAYSLERSLAVVLGRPLTLRDEAIDVEFPGTRDKSSSRYPFGDRLSSHTSSTPRPSCESLALRVSQYSFQFDQLTAEIKLMLYRVRRAPNRFPWLADTVSWRQEAHQQSTKLAEDMLRDLRQQTRFSTQDSLVRTLELKHHQCLLLLHRPSPGDPSPSLESWQVCCSSAASILHVAAELDRFSQLPNTWLVAHTVFVSGITFLYCLWLKPEIRNHTSLNAYTSAVRACSCTLKSLGKTWSVAVDALGKFERLVDITTGTWRSQLQTAGQGMSVDAPSDRVNMVAPDRQAQEGETDSRLDNVVKADTMVFWGGDQDQLELEPQLFCSELGDMSSCFDLDWIFSSNV